MTVYMYYCTRVYIYCLGDSSFFEAGYIHFHFDSQLKLFRSHM